MCMFPLEKITFYEFLEHYVYDIFLLEDIDF